MSRSCQSDLRRFEEPYLAMARCQVGLDLFGVATTASGSRSRLLRPGIGPGGNVSNDMRNFLAFKKYSQPQKRGSFSCPLFLQTKRRLVI